MLGICLVVFVKKGALTICDRCFSCDLVTLDMHLFDIIVGMDWLAMYKEVIECEGRKITLVHEPCITVCFRLDRKLPSLVTNYVQSTVTTLLPLLLLTDEGKVILVLPTIVTEFMDVFPEDLSGLLPPMVVGFNFDLVLGINPISMASYRLAPKEFEKMRVQLDDLLSKGFIRGSY